ncbi:hypothetical protein C4E24_04935 [ANME-1 cluster archaeon AG-394-G21]|nr:hypothetical protein [ANME-1 cluster archaeon AG-394-G21]
MKVKMKMKTITLLTLGVLLCSLLLVALPAIAAEDDFVLGVYGNANEDDTIDMRDLTYVKLIFFGEKPETELADAKYDGEINPLDFVQIKLMIVGKEKERTLIDSADRAVTVKKPVERIVVLTCGDHLEALRIVDAMDKVVGVNEEVFSYSIKPFFPELEKVSSVGEEMDVDREAVFSLEPDVVLTYSYHFGIYQNLEEILPGVTLLGLDYWKGDTMFQEIKTLGYVLGNREKAQKYENFVKKYQNIIKERLENIPEDEYPKVFAKSSYGWRTWNKNGCPAYHIRVAGGKNIAEESLGTATGMVDIDLEFVLVENPQVIIRMAGWDSGGGYGSDDPSELREAYEEIINHPGMERVDAVKNGKVYVLTYDIMYHPSFIVSEMYLFKWFHPELAKDLDPKAIFQEYLDEFHGTLWDVSEHGIFVYHPEEHPDGK